MTFKNCKEVIAPAPMEKPSIKETLKAVSSNIPLLIILANLLIVLMGLFGRLGTIVYYAIYVLNHPDLIAVLFTLLSVCGAIGAIFLPFIAKFSEKKTIMILGTSIAGLAFIATYFTPVTNITMIIVSTIIACLPIGFASPLCFSMVADCIDDYQVKTGKRAHWAISSVFSLFTKVASAIVGAVAASTLGLIGYVANTQQTPEVVDGINMLVNLVTGILFVLSTIPLYFYKISKARATENTKELLRRHSEVTE